MFERPAAESVETAGRHRDVVEQHRVDHDPHHRPEREHDAVDRGSDRQTDRQAPDADRDDESDDEAAERGLPSRPAEHPEPHQNRQDRQARHDEGQPQAAADRRHQLLKHVSSPFDHFFFKTQWVETPICSRLSDKMRWFCVCWQAL